MNRRTDSDREQEHAATIANISRLAQCELDESTDEKEVTEALVLLKFLRPGRAEEAVHAYEVLRRDLLTRLENGGAYPAYPWTTEILHCLSSYLEHEGWMCEWIPGTSKSGPWIRWEESESGRAHAALMAQKASDTPAAPAVSPGGESRE
jgi:hypothetical protein